MFFILFLINLKLMIFRVIIVTLYWINERNDNNIVRDEKKKWEYSFKVHMKLYNVIWRRT